MNSTTKMIKILGFFLRGLIKKIPRGYQYGVIKLLFIGFKIKNRPQSATQIATTLGWPKKRFVVTVGVTQRAYSIGHSASVHDIKKSFHLEIGSSIVSWPWRKTDK